MTDLNRDHEIGYEDLDWPTWNMLTGFPREAYDQWLKLDALVRREVVGICQEPETMATLRKIKRNKNRDDDH